MTVATSAWWDAVTALLALYRGDGTLTAAGLRVVDGPILLDASGPSILIVGGTSDPDQEDGAAAGEFTQEWGELGARARFEALTVQHELVIRDGGTDLAARRTTAQVILSQIEALLRTQFTLGVGRLLWAHITSAQINQLQAQTGSAVKVPFIVAAKARLASQ